MATEKENIIKMIRDLPDDVSLDEVIYHLYVRREILRGLEDAKHGRTYTHDQAKKMAEKWLK
ncbi:MAG: hypothetical protein ACTSPS_02000 [Promethearchaeota archaeon]